MRQIVVDYVLNVRNMKTTRRHVSADQHGQFTLLKLLKHTHALFLRHIAGNCTGVYAVRFKVILHTLRFALHVDENHDARRTYFANEANEQRHFVFVGRKVDCLPHPVDRDGVRFNANQFRFVHVLVGKLEDALR